MKILVLESSGNRNGSSNLLAGEFVRGAEEAGHEVTVCDVYRKDIKPCLGCNTCGNAGPCVRKDDYENEIKPAVKAADMVVFAMPVYFYNWPASLKVCVDRFYSFMVELKEMRKKAVFIGAAWDDSDEVFAIPKAFYEKVCSYLQFSDQGMVLGRGCGTPDMTRATVYPQQAYELGKSL